MSQPKSVYVAVVGVGGVGRCFLSQLAHLATRLSKSPFLPVPVFLSRSSKVLYTEDFKSLDIGSWQDDLQKSTQSPLSLEQLGDYLSKAPGPAVLVDNTSSEDVAEAYPALLARGVHVVTPNKKGFSGSYDLWRQIFAGAERPGRGLVYHESTVGAGLPIISTLNELVETGDEVQKIEGVFSGTMSFLFNSFAPVGGGGGRFSEEVKKAKDLGFTEPDPRDDLNGLDVARKLTILARISGLAVESPTSFPVESLIPRPLESAETGDEFLARLPEHDDGMDALKKETEAEGKVIRYVGSINIATKEVKVSLEKFDVSHPIAALKGSDNIVSFYTKRYGSNPLIIQGAGAGGEVTAMGVTGDLLKLLKRLP